MEFNNRQAIYLQIADYLCERILKRQWREGEKIPSIRDTAVMVEVNPNTALRTYTFLQEQGIIYNKRGIGYFVADDGYRKTLAFKKQSFVNEELPKVFHTMEILDMEPADLENHFRNYKDNRNNQNAKSA